MREWGHACDVIAPSLIPQEAGRPAQARQPRCRGARAPLPRGELTPFAETDDGVWAIYFNTVLLGTLDERDYIIRG